MLLALPLILAKAIEHDPYSGTTRGCPGATDGRQPQGLGKTAARAACPQHRKPLVPGASVNHASVKGLAIREAAQIIGAAPSTVQRLLTTGDLTAPIPTGMRGCTGIKSSNSPSRVFHPGHPYGWSSGETTRLLGRTRVCQLAERDRPPGVRHEGRWHFRRHEIENLANAGRARRLSTPTTPD